MHEPPFLVPKVAPDRYLATISESNVAGDTATERTMTTSVRARRRIEAFGLVLLGIGLLVDAGPVALAGVVLVAHVGIARALGVGLKMTSSFRHTHAGSIGRSHGGDRR